MGRRRSEHGTGPSSAASSDAVSSPPSPPWHLLISPQLPPESPARAEEGWKGIGVKRRTNASNAEGGGMRGEGKWGIGTAAKESPPAPESCARRVPSGMHLQSRQLIWFFG
eukprot:4255919-Pyramimonas_sp.AAC.1